MNAVRQHDVVILGGGLAGLTLSLQLRQRLPGLDILVVERRTHPVPQASHKVGESSVEIQAHYLSHMLGLEQYLKTHQLQKFGFRFFFSDGIDDIASITEMGASRVLPTLSYQLDRGILENDLGEMARARGVRFVDGALVREFALGEKDAPHRISYDSGGAAQQVDCRWLIDASGRAGLLKRRLGLAQENEHDANAVWFRIGERIDVNHWSSDAPWLDRCNPPNRWLSTNHLIGEGYWVWLIPLASGSHSVGIVADNSLHPLDRINTFEKAMQWLAKHQPRLHEDLEGKRDKLQDFAFFKHFSYGCKKVYSGNDRWALTGEAGLFLDPFYSPGGDFIAISNTFITELVAKDIGGDAVGMLASVYENIYFSCYDSMLPLYTGQYKLFGDAEVLPMKVLWDYTFYWGVLCQLFFQQRLTDVSTMKRLQAELAQARALNIEMQRFLRAWGEVSARRNPARMLDQASLDWFVELNRGLTDRLDDAAFAARMQTSCEQLAALALQIVERATSDHPALDASDLLALLSDTRRGAAPDMLFDAIAG